VAVIQQRLYHKWVKYVLIFIIMAAASNPLCAQLKEDEGDSFGAGFYQEVNGLITSRNVCSGQYIHKRRTFELGVLLNHYERASGFVFRHQYYLNQTPAGIDFHPSNHNIRPYLVYNFIYNNGISERYLRQEVGEGALLFESQPDVVPTMNSIEHYLGVGTEMDLFGNVFFNVYAGGGLYFYRNNLRVVREDDRLLPEQLTGFTWNVSMGIGYRFY